MERDCIAAISTPFGEGAIAIIRLSGDSALDVAEKLFRPAVGKTLHEVQSHTLTLGWITGKQGEVIDQALIGVMRAPRSYTGEDIAEINCHGGMLVARMCLERALEAGARLAEPGEFTQRAFLNGRMNITQAEAVAEIIRARSERALTLSLRNLQGALKRSIDTVQEKIVQANSRLEASIDFAEDVGEPAWEEIFHWLTEARQMIRSMLDSARRNRLYTEGASVVIAGKPNVGKSSLLNALVKKDRAIVTSIPGTTRDIIEENVLIQGIPITLRDTAGIRHSSDHVEQIGIDRARAAIKEADAVIFMMDAESGLTEQDYLVRQELDPAKTVVLVNKEDLEQHVICAEDMERLFPDAMTIWISAKEDRGIAEVEAALAQVLKETESRQTEDEIMINTRQQQLLLRAMQHVNDALDGIEAHAFADCIASDTWGALNMLQEITGQELKEAVFDRIFRDFCIGK